MFTEYVYLCFCWCWCTNIHLTTCLFLMWIFLGEKAISPESECVIFRVEEYIRIVMDLFYLFTLQRNTVHYEYFHFIASISKRKSQAEWHGLHQRRKLIGYANWIYCLDVELLSSNFGFRQIEFGFAMMKREIEKKRQMKIENRLLFIENVTRTGLKRTEIRFHEFNVIEWWSRMCVLCRQLSK